MVFFCYNTESTVFIELGTHTREGESKDVCAQDNNMPARRTIAMVKGGEGHRAGRKGRDVLK